MKTKRRTLEDLPDNITTRLNALSLFTSTGFAQLWQEIGSVPVFWTVEQDDNILAVMPGLEGGRSFWRRFQAMPDGLYSRIWFAPDSDIDRRDILKNLMKSLCSAGYMKLYINDYYRYFEAPPGYNQLACQTSLVAISAKDWQPPDKKIQSEIRKAEREGVTVADFAIERDFDKFIVLMRQTEHRHGRVPKYPPRFFEALARLAHEDKRIRWVGVERNGETAASHIYFIDNEMVLNWQIYFNKKFSSLKPNQYILYTIARQLAAQGVQFLNLGATPSDAAGLETYKDKWGGEIYRYPCYFSKSFPGKLF
ncbi:MAG: GNAT family N-acetyltransferase [candidate division Zixibacteria bacterium]|nr:GNAT family N-acetyltransferase [candidate division Zixibacteria bacterium]